VRLRASAFALPVLSCIFALPSSAQQIDVSGINVAQTPLPGSGHDYIKMLQETVNPANGSLSVRIEAPVPKQRGDVNYPYYIFGYDSSGVSLPSGSLFYSEAPVGVYTPSFEFSWTDNSFINTGPGVGPSAVGLIPGGSVANAGVGQVFYQDVNYTMQIGDPPFTRNCGYFTGYSIIDPQLTRHSLGMQWVYNDNSTGQGGAGDCGIASFFPEGDSQYQATLVGTVDTPSVQFYATDAHGRSYTLEDTNGNGGGGVGQKTIVNNQVTAIAIPGITNPYSITYGTQSRSYQPGSNPLVINGVPACGVIPKETSTKVVVNNITLPNGQKYTFGYQSPYALLNSITYPTGAKVTYIWTPQTLAESLGVGPGNAHCDYQHDWPYITQRIVSFDGTTNALEQDFSYQTFWGTGNQADQWTTKTTTVTTKDLKRPGTPSFQTVYAYFPFVQIDQFSSTYLGQVAVENQIVYKDWNGAVLKTVTKNWFSAEFLASECVTLPNGSTSGRFYGYGALSVVTDVKEYDYVLSSTACAQGAPPPSQSIAVARETKMTPQTFPVTPLYPTASIFDRPSSVQVFGNGSLVAETDYAYDGGTITPVTAYAHDDTNFPATYKNRGNATTITRDCLQGCSTNAVSTYTFDETGQMLSVTDACGNNNCTDMTGTGSSPTTDCFGKTYTSHTTTYCYTDSYSSGTPPGNTNTFVTKIKRPTTNNGVSHVSNYAYSYPGGQLTSAEDENSQFTYYTYADPFARLTLATYPGGGQTSIAYDDAGPTPTVTASKLIVSGRSATTISVMDGVGHQIGTQLTSDPQGTVYTANTYDGLGHILTASNPYRSTSDPTYGITTYNYDAFGRTCLVAPPDGTVPNTGPPCPSAQPNNTVYTVYSGNQTTVTDQAGITRTTITDGLGRLTNVSEAPNNGNFQTIYTYDALDDLHTVVQGSSHSRTFGYDSLKRLTSAKNPESGTVAYTYDANSNVVTKTDAVGRVETYTYDALNRVLSETPTPWDASTKIYAYDTSNNCSGVSRCANIGQLVSTQDFQGDEVISYDPLDRQASVLRNTLGITKTATYSYNYDHSLASLLYPSGRTITYSTDSAGRPSSATDIANNITYIMGPCLNGISNIGVCYAPQGAIAGWSYGMDSGNYPNHEASYNNRLQPAGTDVFMEGGNDNLIHLTYNFVDANGHNDGNVIGISNYYDATRSQQFTYDQMNRLATAETTSTSATSTAHCWGEAYNYDNATAPAIGEYGNLTTISVASTAYNGCTQESLSITSNTNNQITTFAYDASGNTLNDLTNGCITGQVCYAWYADGHLASANGTTYYYDVHGNRLEKAGSKWYWYGLGSDPLDESDTSGNITDEYVYFGGKRVAHRAVSSNTIYFYGQDMLGTSRVIFSSAGVLCYDADFYPFGGERAYTNTCAQNYKFTGKERDSESGLDNFIARYDASSLGRFMTPDEIGPGQHPENPQSWNLYSYVMNNPLTLTDPTGQYVCAKSVSASQCDNFQKTLDAAQKAANNLTGQAAKDAQRAIDAYGKQGVDNGVTIAQGKVGADTAETAVVGAAGAKTANNPNGQNITVTFDKASNMLNGQNVDAVAALTAHEGVHVADQSDWVSSGFADSAHPSNLQTDHDAYTVELNIFYGLGNSNATISFGSRDYRYSLPLQSGSGGKIDSMIKREDPRWNLDAWQKNTTGAH
jgi:RHS repeat-associated protein